MSLLEDANKIWLKPDARAINFESKNIHVQSMVVYHLSKAAAEEILVTYHMCFDACAYADTFDVCPEMNMKKKIMCVLETCLLISKDRPLKHVTRLNNSKSIETYNYLVEFWRKNI